MNPSSDWLTPDWPAPASVRACVTTRAGGVSLPPFDSLNLGDHVEDAPLAVAANRQVLVDALGCRPAWLQQVHSPDVVEADSRCVPTADASWTATPGTACAVLTADCLPVLFCNEAGTEIAAAHAGWRGLAAGVLEAALLAVCDAAGCAPAEVCVWLGPCIGPRQFEVGADVLQAFGARPGQTDAGRFVPRMAADGMPRWLADLQGLAEDRLAAAGVRKVSAERACTVEQGSRFFSYRRDGVTGRMAAAVWIRG